MSDKLTSFERVVDYLYNHTPSSRDTSAPAEVGLGRTKYFLNLLGNPQEKMKIIHIAGTSGKGSTAYLTSLLLTTCGFKVGLELSPHVLDIRERLQINGRFISRRKFVRYLNELLPFIKQVKASEFGAATYFETLTVLAFYVFFKEGVSYAVVETGMGGLYDATNSVKNSGKLSVITQIGIDHRQILGRTIKEISLNKAGIIQSGNQALSVYQAPSARKNIEERVMEKGAKLAYLKIGQHYKNVRVDRSSTHFNFSFRGVFHDNLILGLRGLYQAENCSLALATLIILSGRDGFFLNWLKIRRALKQAHLVGRFDAIRYKEKELIIDGAHNPQKMKSFLETLSAIYPNQKFDFLIAFKRGKDYSRMLKLIRPYAKSLILTNFFSSDNNLSHLSAQPSELKGVLERAGFKSYRIAQNPKQGFKEALKTKGERIVITGSLYFISEIYPLL